MRAVVFRTPGLIDMSAFSIFGASAKPNSTNPIGRFGTELKISVAVLCRLEIPFQVQRGSEIYHFYAKKTKFRNRDFKRIQMRKDSWINDVFKRGYIALPFTTNLGHHWELWQVFRELEANTMDEGGETFLLTLDHQAELRQGPETTIIVSDERFVQEFLDRERTFLPGGLREKTTHEGIQILDRPSQHLYYRGMRVYDLKEPSILTYNFLREIDLTEDRTAKFPHGLINEITSYLAALEDVEMAKKVVSAPKDTLEGRVDYSYAWRTPSEAFRAAVRSVPAAPLGAARYVRSHEVRTRLENPLARWPRPWRLADNGLLLKDANGEHMFSLVRNGQDFTAEERRYIVALLNKDLEGDELDQWLLQAPLPEELSTEPRAPTLSQEDDVPF